MYLCRKSSPQIVFTVGDVVAHLIGGVRLAKVKLQHHPKQREVGYRRSFVGINGRLVASGKD
jgi:hypothetical protein